MTCATSSWKVRRTKSHMKKTLFLLLAAEVGHQVNHTFPNSLSHFISTHVLRTSAPDLVAWLDAQSMPLRVLMGEEKVSVEWVRIFSRSEALKEGREVSSCGCGRVWGHKCYRFLRDGNHGRRVWVRHGDGFGYASLGSNGIGWHGWIIDEYRMGRSATSRKCYTMKWC